VWDKCGIYLGYMLLTGVWMSAIIRSSTYVLLICRADLVKELDHAAQV
jgi:hypothetical protein